jgi:hypothetical protein
MRLPFRMNLIDIEVKALAKQDRIPNTDKPVVDNVFKRPKGLKTWAGDGYSETIKFKAQVYYENQEDKVILRGGDSPDTVAHLTMRKTDYDLLLVKPNKGDLIIKVAEEEVSYEITQIRRAGFLRGKPLLIQIEFEKSKELRGSV